MTSGGGGIWLNCELVPQSAATVSSSRRSCIMVLTRFGDGRTGPITRAMQQAYHDATEGRHPRSTEWLDFVGREIGVRS